MPRSKSPKATASEVDIPRLRLAAQGISRPDFATPEAVVSHLGAIQAQDYPGALWSIALRTPSATRIDVEDAIRARTIIRTWPMRGTLHFVPAADARWMLELLTPRIIKGVAGRHRRLELDDAALRRSRTIITKALGKEPVMTRTALFDALTRGGVAPTGQRGIHILQHLSLNATLCYGPHAGKQPTFTLFDDWIPVSRTLDRDEALRTIAARFFIGHGPATIRDFVWWTGLRVADARLGLELARSSLELRTVNGYDYWFAADAAPALPDAPRAHLLPGFDEYMLGFRDRSAALPTEHANRIVPGANGVFLPTLVLDGQVRGTWRRSERAKSVLLEAVPFTPLPATARKAFAPQVKRYAEFLGSPVESSWTTPS